MKLHDWLTLNADRFIGALKINDEKRPLKGETKNENWLFSEDNPPADRMKAVIAFDKESPEHSIGVLVPNDILVIDLDNKDDGINGVKRWAELSGIPISYKSSSGKGAHIWVQNPFNDTIKSTYAKVSGIKSDKAIELFSGHKQYIKLPAHDIDLDLDNLPVLPKGFLKGVTTVPDASKIDATAIVKKLELNVTHPVHEVHHYLLGIAAPDDYSQFFKLTSSMYALAFYQKNVKGNDSVADDIKTLWDNKCKQSKSYNRFANMNQWDAMAYLGDQGMGLGYLTYNSSYPRFPMASAKQKAIRKAHFKKVWVDAEVIEEVEFKPSTKPLPFSIC